MKITLLPPGTDLVSALASELKPLGRDYGRQWIVFPERRPGHYLRSALAEGRTSAFVPPVIESLDGFINRLYEDRLGLSGRIIDPLDAVSLLFDIHREIPSRLGRSGFLSPDAFFPLGIKLFNDLEEVSLAGAGLDEIRGVEHLSGETVPRESLGRIQSLADFHERFYGRLEDLRLSSPASRLKTVVEGLRLDHLSDVEVVHFAGLYALARKERELIGRLLEWGLGRLLLNKVRGWERALELLNIPPDSFPAGPDGGKDKGPDIEFTKCPDTHGQVFALNKALGLDPRDPPRPGERQAVILCAAETLFPLYQQTLSALPAEGFNISLGYPLARTPLYSFFDKLLELVQTRDEVGRVYATHYLRFVLHPYVKNLYFPGPERRADLTRVLFHSVREALTRRRMKSFWVLEEIEKDEGVRAAIEERIPTLDGSPDVALFLEHLRSVHDRTIRLFRDIRDVEDFAEKLISVLQTISGQGTARLHHFFHPYAEAAFGRLDLLRRSRFRAAVFEDMTGYVQLFRKVVQSGTVPFPGTPLRGLQVLGFWEARGLPLEDVSLLDMNEEVIPAFSREDSLLPFAARRLLGLPTYEDLEGRMSYFLRTLLGRARKARIFFVENTEKEPSRFVEQLLWERQKGRGRSRADSFLRTVQYRVALKPDKPGSVSKTNEMADRLREFRFSASSLDLYLRCPLKFYFRHVLNIREADDVIPRTERMDIGTFVHAVLEDFFRPCLGRPLRPRDLDPGRLREVIDRSYGALYGGDEAGSAFLLKRQTERHLADFLERYQLPLVKELDGLKRRLIIDSLESTWKTDFDFGTSVFRLGARTDRIERRGGDIHILDYKSGAKERYLKVFFEELEPDDSRTWRKAVKSLQLPLYGLVLSRILNLPAEKLRGGVLMLGKNVLGRHIEISAFKKEDEAERREDCAKFERMTGLLLEEICDPGQSFEPLGHREGLCPECPYRTLCR